MCRLRASQADDMNIMAQTPWRQPMGTPDTRSPGRRLSAWYSLSQSL